MEARPFPESARPLLKGVSHVIATVGTGLSGSYITDRVPSHLKNVVGWYLLMVFLHFWASSTLHLINWSRRYLRVVRIIDHCCIYMVIVSANQVYYEAVIPDVSSTVKIVLFGGTVLGMISRIVITDASPTVIALPYIIVGWSIMLDPQSLYKIYSYPDLFRWTMVSGCSFTIGALFYIFRPDTRFRRYFSYHEIFHLFTIMGVVFHIYSIMNHVT